MQFKYSRILEANKTHAHLTLTGDQNIVTAEMTNLLPFLNEFVKIDV